MSYAKNTTSLKDIRCAFDEHSPEATSLQRKILPNHATPFFNQALSAVKPVAVS
jgi:hypothetical protein